MNCVVIGGGVVGLSIAFQLAREGCKVQVVDKDDLGRGASWAGAGILPPATEQAAYDPVDRMRGLSHRLHQQWSVELRERTGIDNGLRCCGGWYLARSTAEAATLQGQRLLWDEQGIEFRSATLAELVEDEPVLQELVDRNELLAAWFLPGECQIRNPRHLQALIRACELLDVQLLPNFPIETIHRTVDRITAVQGPKGEVVGDQFCIASGPWSRMLMEQLGLANGIMPIRGQMLLYRTDLPIARRVISEGHRYLVPRDDGHLLVGSTEEEVGYVVANTAEVMKDLTDWACALLPPLRSLEPIRAWAGLRPGSFDGRPYIGRIPGLANGYVASGHFRSGLHLSCATAVVISDLIHGRIPAIDLDAFRVGRG